MSGRDGQTALCGNETERHDIGSRAAALLGRVGLRFSGIRSRSTDTSIYLHIYKPMRIYICMYVYVYLYIYMHAGIASVRCAPGARCLEVKRGR